MPLTPEIVDTSTVSGLPGQANCCVRFTHEGYSEGSPVHAVEGHLLLKSRIPYSRRFRIVFLLVLECLGASLIDWMLLKCLNLPGYEHGEFTLAES